MNQSTTFKKVLQSFAATTAVFSMISSNAPFGVGVSVAPSFAFGGSTLKTDISKDNEAILSGPLHVGQPMLDESKKDLKLSIARHVALYLGFHVQYKFNDLFFMQLDLIIKPVKHQLSLPKDFEKTDYVGTYSEYFGLALSIGIEVMQRAQLSVGLSLSRVHVDSDKKKKDDASTGKSMFDYCKFDDANKWILSFVTQIYIKAMKFGNVDFGPFVRFTTKINRSVEAKYDVVQCAYDSLAAAAAAAAGGAAAAPCPDHKHDTITVKLPRFSIDAGLRANFSF